jgi:hypothetical protein
MCTASEKLTYFNEYYQNPIESVTDSGVITNRLDFFNLVS